jgi:hypothetical protein
MPVHPAFRCLSQRLDRLKHTLAGLMDRVRLAVVESVGQAVAGIVQDAMLATFAFEQSSQYRVPTTSHSPSLWQDRQDEPWMYQDDLQEQPEEIDYEPARQSEASRSRATRNLRALAVGLVAGLSWLQRRTTRSPLLIAFGAGLLTALASYFGGPLAAIALITS